MMNTNNNLDLDTTRAFLVAAAARPGISPVTGTYLAALADHLDRRDSVEPWAPRSVFRSAVARDARVRFNDAVTASMAGGDMNWVV